MRGIVDALSLLIVGYLLALWIHGGTFVVITSAKLSDREIVAAQKGITLGWSVVLLVWAAASYAARVVQDARAGRKQPISHWAMRLVGAE
jgi:hypothetical protein